MAEGELVQILDFPEEVQLGDVAEYQVEVKNSGTSQGEIAVFLKVTESPGSILPDYEYQSLEVGESFITTLQFDTSVFESGERVAVEVATQERGSSGAYDDSDFRFLDILESAPTGLTGVEIQEVTQDKLVAMHEGQGPAEFDSIEVIEIKDGGTGVEEVKYSGSNIVFPKDLPNTLTYDSDSVPGTFSINVADVANKINLVVSQGGSTYSATRDFNDVSSQINVTGVTISESQVEQGGDFTVDIDIENNGAEDGTGVVDVTTESGKHIDTFTTPSVPAGDSTTVTKTYNITEAGTYTVNATGDTSNTASAQIEITQSENSPANIVCNSVNIEILGADAPEVKPGTRFTVVAELENTGQQTGDVMAEMTSDDGSGAVIAGYIEYSQLGDVGVSQLDGGEKRTFKKFYSITDEGDYTISVSQDGTGSSESITVSQTAQEPDPAQPFIEVTKVSTSPRTTVLDGTGFDVEVTLKNTGNTEGASKVQIVRESNDEVLAGTTTQLIGTGEEVTKTMEIAVTGSGTATIRALSDGTGKTKDVDLSASSESGVGGLLTPTNLAIGGVVVAGGALLYSRRKQSK